MTQNPTFSLASLVTEEDLQQVQKMDLTPEMLYTPNERDLLPLEHDILTRYLDARPNWMFVKMPEGTWAGDERRLLTRHGFKTELIPPFEPIFYDCARFLLREKQVTVPEVTPEEISGIRITSLLVNK
jgi:hypothetical protein